jgi:ribonuclease E
MLVDANHPEETRVVVLDGTRLEEFDLETSTKKQNKGNIYLAKVVRVEPSLQAAFVDYGGNRHGFLAFSEIHPDYYQIPVADREALLAEARAHDEKFQDEQDEVRENAESDTAGIASPESALHIAESSDHEKSSISTDSEAATNQSSGTPPAAQALDTGFGVQSVASNGTENVKADDNDSDETDRDGDRDGEEIQAIETGIPANGEVKLNEGLAAVDEPAISDTSSDKKLPGGKPNVEEVGGEDETDENLDVHRRKFVASRRYKIQEVIKRRQILLIQVVKEERGNKGAALTTYLSLAGRYCVLMPNSSRGGGVSRKITSLKDRRRLKSIVSDLKVSEDMAVILRTAGAERSKAEVKRDFEYLQRTWNQIREVTMESRAPAQIHEEANLIKRSIRDIYSKDIEEIYVEGEEGYKAAKEFMRTLTPSHAKKVKRYKDEAIPLLHRYQVESQLDAIHLPTAQLKSGGSIVFGQTEALVAIDVNSGRATKERHIEETALKTNLEAADEVARQLRLRDLAGLVVIDFIDMDENRNNHAVERRLKEALKSDRARIQVGRISHFGLLELSRQRLRPSLIEANFGTCKSCAGTGMIRSIESTSIQTLRAIEEEGLRNRTRELTVTVHPDVALYILNYKRTGLEEIQNRYEMNVFILGDGSLVPPDLRMEKIKGHSTRSSIDPNNIVHIPASEPVDDEESEDKPDSDADEGKKRRRRRKRKRKDEGDQPASQSTTDADEEISGDNGAESTGLDKEEAGRSELSDSQDSGDGPPKRSRRRGRRGGKRRKRDEKGGSETKPSSDTQIDGLDNVSNAQNAEIQTGQGNVADAPNNEKHNDPIPVQPVPSLEPKPPSRFLDVFRRGADALRPSASSETARGTEVKSASKEDNRKTVSADSVPADATPDLSTPKEPRAEPVQTGANSPGGPTRRGWWNREDSE